MKLSTQIVPPTELPPETIGSMYQLMASHYDGVTEAQFAADLAAKQWVILLHDAEALRGFSTQTLFTHTCEGRTVRIVFSGDTIIDKRHWGSLALPVAWGRLMLSLLAEQPSAELYWLLTSKGYKTYRFLPVFFREFLPSPDQPDTLASAARLLRSAATARFGARFDPTNCILRASPEAQRLRSGIADLDEARLHDPHIAFFQRRNPGHASGEELVCLARFHPDNLTPFILRHL